MSENASTGRRSNRAVAVGIGLALLASLGVGVATVGAGAQGDPPERLPEAEILARLTAAPEQAPPFRATLAVEQTVIPQGLIGASDGDAVSGENTARIWRGGPDALRAELQGENGDTVLVRNGDEVSVYDGATNTLKVGEKPDGENASEQSPVPVRPEEIEEFLAEVSPTSKLTAGEPVEAAGRWAYPLTLEPRDGSQTLVEGVETLVDAQTFVPLSFELYAEDVPEPVVRYEARDFEVGPVSEARFQLEPPPGATVEQLEPGDGERPEGAPDKKDLEPRVAGSLAEASELAGFQVEGLSEPPGGRQLEEIQVAGDAAALRYGSGWGTVTLVQKPDTGDEDFGAPQRNQNEEGPDLQVPNVSLGDGVRAREVATPVGTVLTWSDGGISYVLAGSVKAGELEAAARSLAG